MSGNQYPKLGRESQTLVRDGGPLVRVGGPSQAGLIPQDAGRFGLVAPAQKAMIGCSPPPMTAHPKPSPEALRRAEIRQQRKSSTFWTAVYLLGSLNLAVILLITIAGAIAFATIMESKFDSKVAGYYIYNAAWFNFWLMGLALNLLCAALTRWPWQRKHLGFVVTHAGIILLLSGAVIGKTLGFEAFVTLDKTKPPESRLFMRDNVLTIATSGGVHGEMPIDTDLRPPTEKHPLTLPLENSALRLVVDRVTDNLVPDDQLAASADSIAPAGVALHFVNAGMGQNVPATLMFNDDASTFDFFGMARVQMVASLDEAHPIALPPPAPVPTPPRAARDATPFHETQMVFEKALQGILDTDSDAYSGYGFKLVPATGAGGDLQVVVANSAGTSRTWSLHDLQSKWESLAGDGDPVLFRVAKYWPDFEVKGGQPVSLSDQPRNPVILVQITGPSKLLPPAVSKPADQAPPLPVAQGLIMRVALAKEPGRLVYELERAGKIEGRGTVAQGESIHLGWSKWEAKVDDVLAHAELHREVKEAVGKVPPMLAAQTRPGIRAHLLAPDGSSGPVEWIPGGSFREIFAGNDFAQVGFGQRTIPLSFRITLLNFEVPRDEGTDTPSNFISTLRFDDPTTGRTRQDQAFMNSPAMFPGDFWRSLLGWNYKFSQANWNPQNLNETTLQVLYDPGWPLKWTGSIGICCGIALMFYFMPKRSPQERSGREEPEAAK